MELLESKIIVNYRYSTTSGVMYKNREMVLDGLSEVLSPPTVIARLLSQDTIVKSHGVAGIRQENKTPSEGKLPSLKFLLVVYQPFADASTDFIVPFLMYSLPVFQRDLYGHIRLNYMSDTKKATYRNDMNVLY